MSTNIFLTLALTSLMVTVSLVSYMEGKIAMRDRMQAVMDLPGTIMECE